MPNDGLLFQELLVSMKKWGEHYIPSFFFPRLHIRITQPHIFRNASESFDLLLKSCVSVRTELAFTSRKEPQLSRHGYFTFLPCNWQNLDYRHREGAEETTGTCNFPSLWLNFLEMPGKMGSFGYRMPKVVDPNVSDLIWKCSSEHAIAACPCTLASCKCRADWLPGRWERREVRFSVSNRYLYIKVQI